jgi:hypothetical protein
MEKLFRFLIIAVLLAICFAAWHGCELRIGQPQGDGFCDTLTIKPVKNKFK